MRPNNGCSWITRDSIQERLESHHLESVAIAQSHQSNHAARIATLVIMLRAGIVLDPIVVMIEPCGKTYILDGNHRMRAYQFTRRLQSIPWVILKKSARQ